MIEVQVDVLPVMECIGDMSEALQNLYTAGLLPEFVAWQEDDMNRKFPHMVPTPPDIVYTMVYPRSRLSKNRKRGGRFYQIRARGMRTGKRSGGGRPAVGSNRPILRPVLFTMLADRMDRMMQEQLKWQ